MSGLLSFFTYHTFLAILVEQLLLVVGGRPVTLSELEQEARLHLALTYSGDEVTRAQLSSDYLCVSLRTLAMELLIEAEAQRINWPEPSTGEVEQARLSWMAHAFAEREAYETFLKTHEFTVPDLNSIFARHLRVASMMKHFITDKIVSERLLTEQAVTDYFNAHSGRFASREEALSALTKEVTARITRDWTEELLKRHKVQQVKIPEDVVVNNVLGACNLDSDNLLLKETGL